MTTVLSSRLGGSCSAGTKGETDISGKGASADWAASVKAIVDYAPELIASRDLLGAQVRLLALLGSSAPLNVLLDGLANYVETWADGMLCSVLLADNSTSLLVPGAAPSLPASYVQAIGSVPIEAGRGSCGTAAALREITIVDDVEHSSLWANSAATALAHGLRACWSMPVFSDAGELLGTLALYYGAVRAPTSQEIDLIRFAASLAALVIQRHGASEQLRASEARLQTAVAGTGLGLWDCDRNGVGVWFGDWCESLNIDPCAGHDWEARWCEQVHPEDLQGYLASDSACEHGTADSYVAEYRIRQTHGHWRWLHERGRVSARDAGGRPTHYIGVCIDIDDRKNAEIALRRSEERLRAFARVVQGYVFEARVESDRSIQFTWADDALANVFGCEREEVNRRGWHSFVDPRDWAATEKRLIAIMGGATSSIELRIASATGQKHWLRMAAEPVRDPATGVVTGLIGMAEDVTERKVLTEQMFESVNREQRRIGNDLHDELGQVLTGASLLLRGCHTSTLRGIAVTPGEIERIIDLITGAIENTRSLAHGLAPGTLDFGGLPSALENLAAQSRRWSGLDIRYSSDPLDLVTLDATSCDHLYRIVQEAITNVARHASAQRADIATRVIDGALEVDVRDDGIGTPELVTRGFGLRTMRYRAEAIGAELQIGRNWPRGTRVAIRLPLRANSEGGRAGDETAWSGWSG